MSTISQTLAKFTAGLRWQDIPPEVTERARHLILDAVGCALAAGRFDFASVSLRAIAELAGKGDSVVIGQTDRLPMRDAVLANGILAHGLDYDDTHSEGIAHLTVATFPAALAVSSHLNLEGRDLLLGYIAGIEAGARLASVAQGAFHQVGFHPTSVIGAFSSALAAGKLYGLDEKRLAHAQGVALSVASGSLQFIDDGAWTKRFHPGWAGVGGITAAALARGGFIAPQAAYEGRFGLYKAYLNKEGDLSRATRDLGKTWELMKVAVKPFPACHFAHAFADAGIALKEKVDFRKVKAITALVPEGIVSAVCEPAAAKRRPASDYDAKFSLPYILAASLVRGRFSLAELEEEALQDEAILAVAEKVDYRVDPDTTFPVHYGGGVQVTTADGKNFVHREPINRGSADRPLTNHDVVKKFMENSDNSKIRDAVLKLENLKASDFAERLAG